MYTDKDVRQYIERLKILTQKLELQGTDIELSAAAATKMASRVAGLEQQVEELLGGKE